MAERDRSTRDPADPGKATADYDPAASGAMGDQSGGGDYPHPDLGAQTKGRANGGQSNPAYSGTGHLAGTPVGPRSERNAVRDAVRDDEPPSS